MANIALITLVASHGAPTNTKLMLEGLGHVVTTILSSDATTNALLNYDLIVWCRGSDTLAHTQQVMGAFNQGIPIISGYAGGVTSTVNLPIQALGVVESPVAYISSDADQSRVQIRRLHPVLEGYGNVGDYINMYPSNAFMVAIPVSAIRAEMVNNLICNRDGDLSRISTIIVEKGTTVNGLQTPAHMAHFDWCYGLSGYTNAAIEIFERTISLFTQEAKVISGVIKDSSGALAERRVFAVDLMTNSVFATTVSNASGEYSLGLIQNRDYAIFCVDSLASPIIYVG